MAEDKDGNYVPLDLEELRLRTHRLAIELPEAYVDYFTNVIELIQHLESERMTRMTLCSDIRRLQTLGEKWKKRAEQHGCNVEDGDPDCG
jgi:hypothetical protein